MPYKGCKNKNVYRHKNGYYSFNFYITYIHVTPITGSAILSDFQILLQNLGTKKTIFKVK